MSGVVVLSLAAGGVIVALLLGIAGLAWLWFRPGMVKALAVGAYLSLLVVVPWAVMADLTIGPSGPLDLTGHDLGGSAARVLAGTSGNAAELAAVVLGLCVACSVLAGWRSRRRPARLSPPLAAVEPSPGIAASPGLPPVAAGAPSARRRRS